MTRKKTINIRDLFIEPNFNELEAVSTDSKGEPKKLRIMKRMKMRILRKKRMTTNSTTS